jgi:small subunit ribosomal protein S13
MLVFQGKKIIITKKIIYALPLIYGIGKATAIKICKDLGIVQHLKIEQLTEDQQNSITKIITLNYQIENTLKNQIKNNISSLIKINCNKGVCHKKGLPVRGQRSRTNARTQKQKIKENVNLKYK